MGDDEISDALFCPFFKKSALFGQYRTLPLFSRLGMSKILGNIYDRSIAMVFGNVFSFLFGDWRNLFFEKKFLQNHIILCFLFTQK